MERMCSSPRLKANAQRNMTALLAFASKLPASDVVELAARLKARQAEHAAYCHAAENQQIPPSPAMETCLAYWQDQIYAEIQRGEQLVAQANTQQGIGNFLGAVGNALGNYADRVARTQPQYILPPASAPPQACITQPNGGGRMTSCQ
jgi:hypothetical protein